MECRQRIRLGMFQRILGRGRARLTVLVGAFMVFHGSTLTERSCVLCGSSLCHRQPVRIFYVRGREHFLFVCCHSAVGLGGDRRLADVLVHAILGRSRF